MVPPPLVHWLNGLLGLAGLELGIHCDSPSIASTITDWFTRTIWPAESVNYHSKAKQFGHTRLLECDEENGFS